MALCAVDSVWVREAVSLRGRIRSATVTNPSPKGVAWATRARATTAAESADRNVAARLDASFQLNERVESRLQCSVVRDLESEVRRQVGTHGAERQRVWRTRSNPFVGMLA